MRTSDIVAEKEESQEDVLKRHRKEKKALQEKEIALKKAANKGSKAEQKAKKKKVEDEVKALLEEMEERHMKELQHFESSEPSSSAPASQFEPRVTRAQKRREKLQTSAEEREKRIAEENEGVVSKRMLEDAMLQKKLVARQLRIEEIPPDGHCLFRAVEHQLKLRGWAQRATAASRQCVEELLSSSASALDSEEAAAPRNNGTARDLSFQQLRALAAQHMRRQLDFFLPYFEIEEPDEKKKPTKKQVNHPAEHDAEAQGDTTLATEAESVPLSARFLEYCGEMESTAAWGGEMELTALGKVLKVRFRILSAESDDIVLGEVAEVCPASPSPHPSALCAGGSSVDGVTSEMDNEREGWGGGGKQQLELLLSFHLHAYVLGAHYNSIVPL